MTTDEPARGHDPDDWFDEPETGDVWTARVERLARERQAQRTGDPQVDDWLTDRPAPARRTARRAPPRGVLAVAALLILLLLGVLAAAGVFSGSGRKGATASTPSAPRSTPTRPTTAATATQQPQHSSLPTTTLKPGDRGTPVSQLQRALEQAGYSPGAVDGTYGGATTQAVTRFQQAHGLTADGVAGPKTLAALQRALQTG